VLNRAATALRLGASTLLKIGWPDSSTESSNMASSMSTKVRNTTSEETASNRSSSPRKKAAQLGLQVTPART
jgi:hypothetical protein